MALTNFWQLLAGLAMFLYGMFHLEDTLKQLEGRSFKLFLQKHTKDKLSAIFSGAGVTAILQSSSIVNLMVLSFVGAGMLSMRNALGVVIGANVGGTVNSWLVAMLGFEVDIEAFTLPIIGIAGLGLIFSRNKKRIYRLSKFFMGFGLLFLGIGFMKESMDSVINEFDFTPYLNYSRIVFVLIGFVITALVQTSAATVVLVLSALYAKILPLETAVAVVLGAELGTTIKLLIGSIGGIAAKKRVAVGNIIFNITTSLFGFLLLSPIVNFISNVIGLHSPVLILVAFQTFINIAGIILFYFFLNYLGGFLEKRFVDKEKSATSFLQNTSPEITDTAIEMLEKEVGLFIRRVICLNMEVFHIKMKNTYENELNLFNEKNSFFSQPSTYKEKYDLIKQAEGEILLFYSKMAGEEITKEAHMRLNQLMASVRNAMYSAKGIKDIEQDKKDFRNSVIDVKYGQYQTVESQLSQFYEKLTVVLNSKEKSFHFEELLRLMEHIRRDYEVRMKNIYEESKGGVLEEVDISTLLNVNREVYSSSKAIVFSLKDYLLDGTRAEDFDNIPVSLIR